MFEDQSIWGVNRLTHIPHIAKEYGLTLQGANRKKSEEILKEIEEVNVESIPTVFVGEKAFVETVDYEEFKKAVKNNLSE